jgi:hypothetical protein
MRVSRVILVAGMSLAGVLAFTTPASATTWYVSDASGDSATYDSASNMLTVCDHTAGNGTAMATLNVNGGNYGHWTLFDSNGAEAPCKTAGPLSVDDSKSGILYICNNSSCGDIYSAYINHL